jgi:hypothetical protein
MTVCRNDDRWDRSNILFDQARIVRYDKQHRTVEMRHIDYGLGVLQAQVFDAYSFNAVLDLADIYRDLLARDQLAAYEVLQRFYEIGSPAGLEETRQHLSAR